MAVLVLSLAAAGLAASTFLVTAGSQPPAPASDVTHVCRDLVTGDLLALRAGSCAPRVQVEVPVQPGSP